MCLAIPSIIVICGLNLYYMSIEIYVKYWAEIKFVFHCILYFSHVKKVV